jgi:hypothetical protein
MTGDPSDATSLPAPITPTPPLEGSSVYPQTPSTRPTITLPALKDRPSTAGNSWHHLKTMAERARAVIITAPASSALESLPAFATDDPDLSADNSSAASAPADAPAHPLPLSTHSSQTESDITVPGDLLITSSGTSGPFDSDAFLASVAEGSPAPTVPVYPTAAPSNKRTLRRQTSKSLDTAGASGEKPAAKSKTDPPKFFLESDMVLYNHIGLAPPLAGETAIHQRERMIQNEVRM